MTSRTSKLWLVGTLLALASPLGYAGNPMTSVEQLPWHTITFMAIALGTTLYFGHVRFDRFAVSHGPEILTTIGIFGCFFGVSMGLWAFDTKDISRSVPLLLEGIRTAFWASLFGIGGALYLKARHTFRKDPLPLSPGVTGGAGIEDVVVAVRDMQRALSDGGEGSVLGQLKLMRQDQSDGMRHLSESFAQFAKTMAEQNSKALIEALNDVIRDFNQKLTEQFGENFAKLNLAVEKLVVWQQQYRDELDLLKLAQQQAAEDMRVSTDAFSKVLKQAEAFSGIAERLSVLIVALGQELERTVEVEKALHNALGDMKQVTPVFMDKARQMLAEIQSGMTQATSEIQTLTKGVIKTTQENNAEMRRTVTDSFTETARLFNTHVQQISKDAADRVVKLDDALGKELNKSLETLGQQLTALSRKFVEDYTPLTDRLRELVQQARRI
jgi:hypothetical protein